MDGWMEHHKESNSRLFQDFISHTKHIHICIYWLPNKSYSDFDTLTKIYTKLFSLNLSCLLPRENNNKYIYNSYIYKYI